MEANEAASRLTATYPEGGYKRASIYEYKDMDGEALFWRVLVEHGEGNRIIHPLSQIDSE